mmetsp:Transcript_58444/g.187691  ORF Transcript_58444/g.187691 Transcript_58444/m.187691 type:complete len:200 (-) Transcript_58444:129-728(-)
MQMSRSAKLAPKSPRPPTTTTSRTLSSSAASSQGSKAKSHGGAICGSSSGSCEPAGGDSAERALGVPLVPRTSGGTMLVSSPSSGSSTSTLDWKWPSMYSSGLRTSKTKQRARKLRRSSTVMTGAVIMDAARRRHHSHCRHCSMARWVSCSRAAARCASGPGSSSWASAGSSSLHSGSTVATAAEPGWLSNASPAECRG